MQTPLMLNSEKLSDRVDNLTGKCQKQRFLLHNGCCLRINAKQIRGNPRRIAPNTMQLLLLELLILLPALDLDVLLLHLTEGIDEGAC